ncbi:MAG: sensor histidine kinase [Anaerolineales bacterium]
MASLRWRLLLSHLAVILLATLLAGFLLLSSLERYFVQAAEASLTAQARLTAQTLLPGTMTAGPEVAAAPPVYNAVQQQRTSNLSLQAENVAVPPTGDLDLTYLSDSSLQLGAQLDTRIRILDPHGLAVYDSEGSVTGRSLSEDPLVAQALLGQYDSRVAEGVVSVAAPVFLEEELVSVVYLSQPLTDVAAVLSDLRTRWVLSTGVALLLSAGVGLVLSGAITQPLRRLTTAAQDVARGDFETRVPVRSRDELGQLSHAFNDMTGRLRAARQMQTDFVANVSHELRTPLTSVKGMVETLRDGAVDDPEVRDRFLETVESETDRLIRLVNDLLTLSRADSEALNLRRDVVDPGALLRAAVEALRSRARDLGLTLEVEIAPDLPLVSADPDRVAQVLVNLVDNALKYSRVGGQVTVTAGPHEEGVLVEVHDEGIGIPPEALPHVGERFYRADRARSRAHGGSGLGLAIAAALVEAHGGRLWLESREGEGTGAYFTLPRAA